MAQLKYIDKLNKIEEVVEGLVIGQIWQGDTRVVLFVRLIQGVDLTEDLINKIKTKIKIGASPRHVPAKIIVVNDIPRTKSGKIAELAVRDLVHNKKQVIYGWTINDEENSKSLTSMGLDGVITDYPNIIKR